MSHLRAFLIGFSGLLVVAAGIAALLLLPPWVGGVVAGAFVCWATGQGLVSILEGVR